MANNSQYPILHPDSSDRDILRIVDCSLVLGLPREERCDFINNAKSCGDHVRIFSYLNLVYCHVATEVGWIDKLVIPLLLFICCICFYILGITADVRLCPALQMLSKMLRMSETLAGVTLVAFGNGAPDFFSSVFAASNPDRQIYSDIFASSMLTTSLIPGLIIVTWPFKLNASSMLRDVSYILLSISLLNFFLITDGVATLDESLVILIAYLFYIFICFMDQHLLRKKEKAAQGVKASEVDLSKRKITTVQPRFSLNYGDGKNSKMCRQFFLSIIPFHEDEWNESNCWQRFILIFKIPIVFALNLLIPTADVQAENSGWSKLLNSIQLITVPVLVCFGIIDSELKHYMALGTLCVTVPFSLFVLITSRVDRRPKYHWIFAIYSAVGATCVISIAADEICELIYCLGFIFGVSSSFLGATLLAWGNCLGDIVANLMLAKHGFQTMGFAACFGAPIFNLLFVFGFTLTYAVYSSGSFQVSKGVFGEISNLFLIIHCASTLIWMSLLDFNARRIIGILCIVIYTFFFTFTVLTEMHIIDGFDRVYPKIWS